MADLKVEIYEKLFNAILDGQYGEGFHLTEEAIAGEFGVSRTPVREVLKQLAMDGMIRLNPNRGAIVKALTADDVEEIYEIRKRLEVLALELAIPFMSLERLSELRRQTADTAGRDSRELSDLDADLHRYIMLSSKRQRLIGMLSQLMRLMQSLRARGFSDLRGAERATEEHLALIDALLHREGLRAKQILIKHIDMSKKLALKFLTTHPNEGQGRRRG